MSRTQEYGIYNFETDPEIDMCRNYFLYSFHGRFANVVMCDGAVRSIVHGAKQRMIAAMISRDSGDLAP